MITNVNAIPVLHAILEKDTTDEWLQQQLQNRSWEVFSVLAQELGQRIQVRCWNTVCVCLRTLLGLR